MLRALITAVVFMLLYGCKKSQSDPSTLTIPHLPPVSTAVGAPTGSPVTMTIGSAGGKILSADGRVELDFPPNALTTNTDITIQPVTNTAPNGTGVSYHFMPDGTKFGVPVTLTFHYSNSDANGTDPLFFYIAFQDSAGIWQADFKNRGIDTVAKTASLSISHFSNWSIGSQFYLLVSPVQVTEKQTSEAYIIDVNDEGDPNPDAGGEFSLSALPPVTPVPNSNANSWSVNGAPGGNSRDGTISGTETTETYTAPATIDKERQVQISAAVYASAKGWSRGKAVLKTSKIILFENIDLIPKKLSFSVFVTIQWNNTSDLINDIYWDSARFQVDVENGKVTVGNYQNYPPNEVPSFGSVGLQEANWTSDGIGLTNVVGALAILGNNDSIAISLAHEGTDLPYWTITNIADGTSRSFGGDEVSGYPSSVIFIARDSAQAGLSDFGPITTTWSATPLH